MIEQLSRLETSPQPVAAAARVVDPRRHRRSSALALLALGALAVAGGAVPAAASTQLSEGHAYSDIDFTSTGPQISPNGQYAVYWQDAVSDGITELYSVRLDGSAAPVRLSDVLTSTHLNFSFAISPDSSRVVYRLDQDTVGRVELYSVPIDGHLARVKLNPNLSASRNVDGFAISPTSDRVFYVSDQSADQVFELYSVPIAGGTAIRLNHDLPFDMDVDITSFRVNAAGTKVVYRAGWTSGGYWELWSVPVTGPPESAVRISRALCNPGCDAGAYFQISPDSTRVVYLADTTASASYDLFSVPITGPGNASVQLNVGQAGGTTVDTTFLISANSSRVVFRANPTTSAVSQLYSVALAGGTVTRLNGPLQSNRAVAPGFGISPDSSTVVYRSDEEVATVNELYSVPLTGGTPTKLNGVLVGGGDVLDQVVSPNSARVIYRADQNFDGLNELFSVPLGGGTATKLNRTLASGGDVQIYRVSPDSGWVVYGADQDVDGVDKLLAVPLGGGTVLDVNGPLVSGGGVVLCTITPCLPTNPVPAFSISANSGNVLYAADEDVNNEVELYVGLLAGPPGPPTGVVAVPGNQQATVTFVPPVNNGGSGITGFAVSSNPAGGVDTQAGTTALSHLVTGLVNGTSYTFTVRATNGFGVGDASLPSLPVTPATVPGAPTGVVATGWNLYAEVTFAAPASNGGSAITGYTVTSSPAGGIDRQAGTPGLIHDVVGLTNGIPYSFTVVATNAIGPGPLSTASNVATPHCGIFCDGVESSDTSAWSFATAPALNIVKSATSVGPYVVDDPITYSIVVTNTGNVTLTGVTVTDPGATLQLCAPAQPATLAPSTFMICPAIHLVAQIDLDAGSYTNTATADSDQTGPSSDSEVVLFGGVSTRRTKLGAGIR